MTILSKARKEALIKANFNPKDEGVTHVNIYSGSTLRLGRLLSHFAETPFTHPEYGRFQCMEGFYHYISKGMRHEFLRTADGFSARRFGERLSAVNHPAFYAVINQGNVYKTLQNPDVMEAIMNTHTNLPFIHAYRHGGPGNMRYFYPGGYPIDLAFTEIRSSLLANKKESANEAE